MRSLTATALLKFIPTGEDLTLLTVIVRQALLLEYASAAAETLGASLTATRRIHPTAGHATGHIIVGAEPDFVCYTARFAIREWYAW